MATRDGEALQAGIIPRLEWGAGVQKTVPLQESRLAAPWKGCAPPNPRRIVCEAPSAAERRVCHLLPHLRIAAVVHSDDNLSQAEVTIEHIGPGPLVRRTGLLDGWLREHPDVTSTQELPDTNLRR